jgi:hypothetical protein
MEVCVDIDEELLCEFDRAAQAQNITRNTAARGAIAAWLSQARRVAALSKLFDMASSGADPGIPQRACHGSEHEIQGHADDIGLVTRARVELEVGKGRCVVDTDEGDLFELQLRVEISDEIPAQADSHAVLVT